MLNLKGVSINREEFPIILIKENTSSSVNIDLLGEILLLRRRKNKIIAKTMLN